MAGLDRSGDRQDSLDRIECQLAMEEALQSLPPDEQEQLIREFLSRPDWDKFCNEDDWNDDGALAILVSKLGPKGPKGKSGFAVRLEVADEIIQEDTPKFHAPGPDDRLGDTEGL